MHGELRSLAKKVMKTMKTKKSASKGDVSTGDQELNKRNRKRRLTDRPNISSLIKKFGRSIY